MRRRRGRPAKTADDRYRELVAAWEAMRAEPSPSPDALFPSPVHRRWARAVEVAARTGILADARFHAEPAVQAAHKRRAVASIFRQPGAPMTLDAIERDGRARVLILKLCRHHDKWMSLHLDARAHDAACIPKSWSGFVKLLDRLRIPHEDYSPKTFPRS
jgi:hypothetical protein